MKIYYSPENINENLVENVEIYPNPAKNMLTVKAENISNVKIYNAIGQIVFEQAVDGNEMTINTNGFESGVYMLRVVVNGNEVTQKISVIK